MVVSLAITALKKEVIPHQPAFRKRSIYKSISGNSNAGAIDNDDYINALDTFDSNSGSTID